MSVLSHLLRRLFGSPAAAATPAPHRPPARPVTPDITSLCAQGLVRDALKLFGRTTVPADAAEAQRITRESIVPMLQACERMGDAALAGEVEASAYVMLVKAFEQAAHYEACLGLTDPFLHRLGRSRRPQSAAKASGGARLLFFVHNLSSKSAHLSLFCDILAAYLDSQPGAASSIGIAGRRYGEYASSLQRLIDSHAIRVHAMAGNEDFVESFDQGAKLVEAGHYGRLVVLAVPTGISYLSGRLQPSQLAWFSMKFELDCFDHLAHRASAIASQRIGRGESRHAWLQAPPFMLEPVALSSSGRQNAAIDTARQRHTTLLYTVNREEKIRNPDFLRVVADILDRVPQSGFVWTGKQELPEISAYFGRRGLVDRTHFAGWIHPDDLLLAGDVFLDTPHLSGTVAAQAAVSGRPVVTFARSQSWINAFSDVYARDVAAGVASAELIEPLSRLADGALPFEFGSHAAYVDGAVRLSADLGWRAKYSAALERFCRHYYLDKARWAALHFANLRQGLTP